MKAIVGVDAEGHYLSALHLLARLGFNEPYAELVHVDEVLQTAGAGAAPYAYLENRLADSSRQATGECLLGRAKAEAASVGIEAVCTYCLGDDCERLIDRADEGHADIIAVGSTRKSKYGALFLGSVGRGLTIAAHRSVLVAKKDVAPTGPVTAVFATDGSDYAADCLRLLVRMHPKGIQKIAVVSAVDNLVNGESPHEIKRQVDSLVAHLLEEGYQAAGHVVEGAAPEVIDAVMESLNADVLLLGAQGHGVMERLVVGSLSLQEVVATPHSVLLLRLPKA